MGQKNNNESSIEIDLDCSLSRFINNGICKEEAICWLSDLIELADLDFSFDLITKDVFSGKVKGKENGKIQIIKRDLQKETERQVEDAAICLSFLFFSNELDTSRWVPTSRRGGHWDYWCLDDNDNKMVVEVGGSTSQYGAKRDQTKKKKRFSNPPNMNSEIYISSVGFEDGDHIVSRYS